MFNWKISRDLKLVNKINIFKFLSNLTSFAASYDNSTFDLIYVSVAGVFSLFDDSLKKMLTLIKPKGNVIFRIAKDENFTTRLLLLGYMNMSYDENNKCKVHMINLLNSLIRSS